MGIVIALISVAEKGHLQLSLDGYEVKPIDAENTNALFTLLQDPPDLYLFTSYEATLFLQTLRSFPKMWHIPALLITSGTQEIGPALQRGVDAILPGEGVDALPVYLHQFAQRLQTCAISPLTNLPGGVQIERAIENMLQRRQPWSLLYLDLDSFKAFNDAYGFLAGNELLRLTGGVCQRSVRQYGNPGDFVGHIGGDDFLIITTPDRADLLRMQISTLYTQESMQVYRAEDLRRGAIRGIDRKGRVCQFPLITLSLSMLSSTEQITSLDTLSKLLTLAKRQAKSGRSPSS